MMAEKMNYEYSRMLLGIILLPRSFSRIEVFGFSLSSVGSISWSGH